MYKSNQKGDVRKFEALNLRLLDLMTAQQPNIDATEDAKSGEVTLE